MVDSSVGVWPFAAVASAGLLASGVDAVELSPLVISFTCGGGGKVCPLSDGTLGLSSLGSGAAFVFGVTFGTNSPAPEAGAPSAGSVVVESGVVALLSTGV